KCRDKALENCSIGRTKRTGIMRMSSSSFPQPPAPFSDGTRRVLCAGPPPEPRRAVGALFKNLQPVKREICSQGLVLRAVCCSQHAGVTGLPMASMSQEGVG